MEFQQKIIPINIEDEMKTAYIDYSMSVIVSRALPDVRDGLKPVHRRVLYGMAQLGLTHNKSHKKSARIVGEVLGKYHPHGDSSVYDTMVRMAQPWSLRYPLVNGQGNFGSIDGDGPAAMRYTEAKLERISNELLADLDKNTVDFKNNFDDTLQEPSVLPARLPHLLVNGASGIAVGMATNMLPHNLSEIVAGILAYLENNEITLDELMKHVKAPDFPTGGTVYGLSGVRQAFETGRGRVIVRAKTEIEVTKSGRERIIVTEIPYQINKSNLIIKIADMVNKKKIEGEGISDIRDESDRSGMRIVFELKKNANANVVLSKLYKYSALQSSYGVNNICLVNGRPQLLNLKQLIQEFVKFRLDVLKRRAAFDLARAEKRARILKGLIAALDSLDDIISLIRATKTVDDAKKALMTFNLRPKGDALGKFAPHLALANNRLDEEQAKAILDMRLQRLTGLERKRLVEEFKGLIERIEDLKDILAREARRIAVLKKELMEVEEKYGGERNTDIIHAEGEISIEDMISNEKVLVTISHLNYVKRIPISDLRQQQRGGRGSQATKTRDGDFTEYIFSTHTHNYLLLFTDKGRCYWLHVYEIPEGTKTSKGRAIQNILQIPADEKVKAFIPIEDLKTEAFLQSHNLIFASKNGLVKKSKLKDYSRPRTKGINAITIREDDELIEVRLTNGDNDIILGASSGKSIRFSENDVRTMGRMTTGVRGMFLNEGDYIVGMVCVDKADPDITILSVANKGLGKRTQLEEYRTQSRGGKGIKTMNVTKKTGQLITLKAVKEKDGLMIMNRSGLTIRLAVDSISIMGRDTQGVKLIDLKDNDSIADIALIRHNEEEEENPMEVESHLEILEKGE